VIVNARTPQVFNTIQSSPDCSGVGGGLTCSFLISVPYGDVRISATTFAATDGGGPSLDQGSVRVTIQPGLSAQSRSSWMEYRQA
jgi:hypothetical protein